MTAQSDFNPSSAPERHCLELDIGLLASRWQQGLIDDSTLAASYFLLWQIERHGKRFASRKRADDPACTPESVRALIFDLARPRRAHDLSRLLATHHHLKVPECATQALVRWLKGDLNACLHTHLPEPRDVLELQCHGKRPVTLILDFPEARTPVLHKANAQAFLLHDLEHITKFTLDPQNHARQVGFFRALRRAIDEGVFATPLEDPCFNKAFNYLISDMNAHPIHCLRYLRAILVDQALRAKAGSPGALDEGEERQLIAHFEALASLWHLAPVVRRALLEIGQGNLSPMDARCLEDWFEHQAYHARRQDRGLLN